MRSIIKYLILFLIGGTLYWILELLWRGRSHPVMVVIGGACFILCGAINEYIPWEMPLAEQGLIGAAIVTAVELISGFSLNICLGMDLWDYSDLPVNLLGQICLPFSMLWILVAMLAIVIDDWLRYWIFHEERPHYSFL